QSVVAVPALHPRGRWPSRGRDPGGSCRWTVGWSHRPLGAASYNLVCRAGAVEGTPTSCATTLHPDRAAHLRRAVVATRYARPHRGRHLPIALGIGSRG